MLAAGFNKSNTVPVFATAGAAVVAVVAAPTAPLPNPFNLSSNPPPKLPNAPTDFAINAAVPVAATPKAITANVDLPVEPVNGLNTFITASSIDLYLRSADSTVATVSTAPCPSLPSFLAAISSFNFFSAAALPSFVRSA